VTSDLNDMAPPLAGKRGAQALCQNQL